MHKLVCRLAVAALLAASTAIAGAQTQTGLYHYDEFGNRVSLSAVGQTVAGQTQYQVGGGQYNSALYTLTDTFVIRAHAGTNVQQLANQWGVSITGQINAGGNFYIMQAANPLQALQTANRAFEQGQVAQVFTQLGYEHSTRQIPNDPRFVNQWHLRNTGQGGGVVGHDVNAHPLWNFTTGTGLGRGVTIGIVDDGLRHTHEDIIANYRANLSWDYVNNTTLSATTGGGHGTPVGGVAGARGNNSVGGSGVAPESWLAGIRLLGGALTDAREAQALSHHYNRMVGGQFDGVHIYNNSWGPPDNATRRAPGPLVRAVFEEATSNGRGGLGNIYVWAGGNGNSSRDNVNYDGWASSRYTIAVGSTTNFGLRSSYSELGACLLVNAPSDGGSLGINTTASGSNASYTTSFGGTSSASPAAAGVVALMLEANPNLGWRDVQHILVHTARKNNPNHFSWVTNGAGLRHSDEYGFGTVDAQAAVNAALTWTNVAPFETISTGVMVANATIPDGSGTVSSPIYGAPVSRSIEITESLQVEHVEVVFNTTGGRGGHLEVVLTSPSGTSSLLAQTHNDNSNYSNWLFMSVKNWDEDSQGTWTLTVRDGVSGFVSTWTNWSLNIYGTSAAVIPEPGSGLALLAFGLAATWVSRRRRVV